MDEDKKIDYTRTKKYKELKKSLLDQLEDNGNSTKYFIDLVELYMSLWVVCQKLIADIDTRGVQVMYQNGKDQWGYKKNDSVNELSKTNAQMLKILVQLGIKATAKDTSTEDSDDEL